VEAGLRGCLLGEAGDGTVVDLLVLGGRQVAAGAVQAPVVVPVDPLDDEGVQVAALGSPGSARAWPRGSAASAGLHLGDAVGSAWLGVATIMRSEEHPRPEEESSQQFPDRRRRA
jgi:hypothetical protein